MPLSAVLLVDPGRVVIQLHRCPKCRGAMVLHRVKPSRIGYETHTFQGVSCDHVYKLETATASMKWMSSGLRAPV
jgi:hypothetical protein